MPQFVGNVATNEEDGYVIVGSSTFDNLSNTIELRSAAAQDDTNNGFFRFANVTIPQGATIDAATLTIKTGFFDDLDITITAALGDGVAAPTSVAEYQALTDTTASVSWVADDLGTSPVASPSIVSVVQEIVNQGTWASGDPIVILCKGNVGTSKRFPAVRTGLSGEPVLTIDYTEASLGGSSIPAIMHHRRLMGVS